MLTQGMSRNVPHYTKSISPQVYSKDRSGNGSCANVHGMLSCHCGFVSTLMSFCAHWLTHVGCGQITSVFCPLSWLLCWTESQNSPGGKGPQKIIWSSLSWERKPSWDCLVPSPVASWKTPSNGDATMSLGRLFQRMIVLTWKFFSCVEMKLLPGQAVHIAPRLLRLAPCEERTSTLPVAALSVLEYSACCSPGRRDLTPLVFPHRAGSPALWPSLWPSFGPSPVCLCLVWIVGTRTGHRTPDVVWQAPSRGGRSPLSLC